MPKKKNGLNKSDFIRSQPLDLSAADVVAKAKEAGLTITATLVYKVRGRLNSKTSKAKKAAATGPSTPAKTADGKLSASDFIRSFPTTMTVKEVAEKAAAAGYTFKPNYVYDVRNAEKKRKAKAARSTSAPKPTAHAKTSGANEVAVPTRAAPSANQSDLGAQFRRIMVELGLAQAEVHYNEVRRQLKAISGS